MDYLPTGSTKLLGEGRYDSFPVVAANGDKVVALWRSAKAVGHVADPAAKIKGAISSDGGKTYGAVFTVAWDDGVALTEVSPVGLAWDAGRKMWVALVLVKTFPDDTLKNPTYSALLLWSLDGKAWTKLRDVPLPGVAWAYVSDLVIEDGRWIVGAYGRFTGGAGWMPLTMVSSNAGQSWSPLVAPSGLPSGLNFAEPRIVRLVSGEWLMMIRCDTQWSFFSARSTDGVSWVAEGTVLGGVSGMPSMGVAKDGSLVLLIRERPVPPADGAHGRWMWASSVDEGHSWTLRDDFPETASGRYMMYGDLVQTADGGLACVFASEDDPAQVWQSSSVYALRFAFAPLSAKTYFSDGIPFVEVKGTGHQQVTRVSTDARGRETRDVVRVRVLAGGGGFRDFELQQGRVARYEAGGRTSKPVKAPVLSESWLINPTAPSKSVRARIISDGERDLPITSSSIDVPALDGEQFPHVTYSGRLGSQRGSTVIRTHAEVEEWQLRACFEGLEPLFWSHHPGLRMPEWVTVTGVKVARFAQICPCGCGHDLADNIGHWRDWTIEWVEQPRPTPDELPHRWRIGEVDVPIGDLPIPIGNL